MKEYINISMNEPPTSGTKEVAYNSMTAVLKRLDNITYNINFTRMTKQYNLMLDYLVDYFKEIYGDLTIKEKECWEEINKLKITLSKSTAITKSNSINPVKILEKLDDLDLKIREAATKHGYRTKQKKSASSAITEH